MKYLLIALLGFKFLAYSYDNGPGATTRQNFKTEAQGTKENNSEGRHPVLHYHSYGRNEVSKATYSQTNKGMRDQGTGQSGMGGPSGGATSSNYNSSLQSGLGGD